MASIVDGGRKEAVKQQPEAGKLEAPLDLFVAETLMHLHIRV
jgi:hypothetical protein